MAQPISTQPEMHSVPARPRRVGQALVVGGTALGAVILFGALVLWFHYGTAVFYEMIASGIAACF